MTKIVLLALLAAVAHGQEFDAAAINSSSPDARGGGYNLSPGRLTAKNETLKDLVKFAYNLHDYQVAGGQRWMETERYEIVATFPATTTDTGRGQMMQNLLASRFGLAIHRESKDITGYALVMAKNGSKLRAKESDEHPGMMLGRSATTGLRTLTGTKAPISELVSVLADLLGRPVLDSTGLTGIYDFTMAWTPDSTIDQPLNKGGGPPTESAAPNAQTGPTLFTAIQETLGLKVESYTSSPWQKSRFC